MRKLAAVMGALLLLPGLGQAADDAATTTSAGEVKAEAEAKPKFPVSGSLVYDNSVGIGTFVANEYARNPAWSMSLSMRTGLSLWEKLKLTLRADVTKNLTTSFQGNGNADGSGESYVRQLTVADLSLIGSVPEIYREPVTGIGVGAGLTVWAPVSMLSRATNQVLALRPSVAFDWSWEGLSLSYSLLFRKNFNTTTNATHNLAYLPNALQFRPGGPEDLGNGEIAVGELRNTSHTLYNSFGASYTFLEKFTASANLFIINSFKYTQPLDPALSSPYATGHGQSDSTWGTLDLSYQAWEHLGFSLGVTSLQPAFTADNKYLRFPFFDFVSPGNNLTAFYFDVVGTI